MGDGRWAMGDGLFTALNYRKQPRMHRGVARDETRVLNGHGTAGEIRHDAAGLPDEENASRDVPRGEPDLPERVEPTARDARQIERGGAGAANAARLLHHARQHLQILNDVLVAFEGKPGADDSA